MSVPLSGSGHWVPASGPPRTVKDAVLVSAITLPCGAVRREDGTPRTLILGRRRPPSRPPGPRSRRAGQSAAAASATPVAALAGICPLKSTSSWSAKPARAPNRPSSTGERRARRERRAQDQRPAGAPHEREAHDPAVEQRLQVVVVRLADPLGPPDRLVPRVGGGEGVPADAEDREVPGPSAACRATGRAGCRGRRAPRTPETRRRGRSRGRRGPRAARRRAPSTATRGASGPAAGDDQQQDGQHREAERRDAAARLRRDEAGHDHHHDRRRAQRAPGPRPRRAAGSRAGGVAQAARSRASASSAKPTRERRRHHQVAREVVAVDVRAEHRPVPARLPHAVEPARLGRDGLQQRDDREREAGEDDRAQQAPAPAALAELAEDGDASSEKAARNASPRSVSGGLTLIGFHATSGGTQQLVCRRTRTSRGSRRASSGRRQRHELEQHERVEAEQEPRARQRRAGARRWRQSATRPASAEPSEQRDEDGLVDGAGEKRRRRQQHEHEHADEGRGALGRHHFGRRSTRSSRARGPNTSRRSGCPSPFVSISSLARRPFSQDCQRSTRPSRSESDLDARRACRPASPRPAPALPSPSSSYSIRAGRPSGAR